VHKLFEIKVIVLFLIAKYKNNSKWFCCTQSWFDLFLNLKNILKCLSHKYQNYIL